jgi:hypothetical protein
MTIKGKDLLNRWVVLKEKAVRKPWRTKENRLFRVDGGFGAMAGLRGTAVFGHNANGQRERWERPHVERFATEEEVAWAEARVARRKRAMVGIGGKLVAQAEEVAKYANRLRQIGEIILAMDTEADRENWNEDYLAVFDTLTDARGDAKIALERGEGYEEAVAILTDAIKFAQERGKETEA